MWKLLTVLALAARLASACDLGGFTQCYDLPIPAVPATDSGFHPVHFFTDYAGISGNMAQFRTDIATAAGIVQDAGGADIQFFTAAGAALTQGKVYFDNTDGDGWWVMRVATGTTSIQVRIGKTGESDLSDFSSSTGVFQDYDLVLLNAAESDWSGNSRYGSFVGGLTTATGKAGLAFDFDGAADYLLSTGLNSQTDTTQCITILVRPDNAIAGTGTGERIFQWSSGTDAYIAMRATWGTSTPLGQIQYQAGAADYSLWDAVRGAGEWSIVTTGIIGTDSSHTWMDGVQTDTDTPNNALATRTQQLAIGARHDGVNPFNGAVNVFYLTLGGASASYPQGCSLNENDFDYDIFFTPGSVFLISEATTAPATPGRIRLFRQLVIGTPVGPGWIAAPASATGACDQVNAALGWDPGQSTPTGNQFVICSPEGERMKTGFAAQ